MMTMVKSAGNPQAVLNMLAQNNPQLRQVLTTVQQSGGDPQRAFFAMCEQRGINPKDILDSLR